MAKVVAALIAMHVQPSADDPLRLYADVLGAALVLLQRNSGADRSGFNRALLRIFQTEQDDA